MNKSLSTGDKTILKQRPQLLLRYLCFAPRNVLYTARVAGSPDFDEDSGGVIALHYVDESADLSGCPHDLTIDIGTTPFGNDVGQFYVRRTPDNDAHLLFVNETAFSSVPVADGNYITIIDEHRIWQKRIRRRINEDLISYNEYVNYDEGYGHNNSEFYPPVANITRDELGNPYKPAGKTDVGQIYRTVDLSAFFSFSKVKPITVIQWDVKDGTIVVGDENSTTIRVHFPPGYREIKLVIDTGFGFAFRYAGIWVFNRDGSGDQPITNFSVVSDQRSEGREMSYAIRSDVDLSVFPRGSAVCYWEEATFGDDDAPDQYIDSFVGWCTQDVLLFRLFRSLYTVKVGGPQAILNTIFGYAQTVFDPMDLEDTLWIHMPNNTPDKMVHYILRIYSNVLEVMNLFFSNYEVPIEGYTSTNTSIWSQINDIVKRYFGVAICDSMGSLFLSQYRFYLNQADRNLITPIMDLDKTSWTDASALELTADRVEKYGLVDLYGDTFDINDGADSSHVWRVWAPGLVQGTGVQSETGYPSIFLRTTTLAMDQLRKLAGFHLARLNNPRPDNTIVLLGNLDVFEPAWNVPITITHNDVNVRHEVLDHSEFMIKNVSVAHTDKAPFKTITLSLEQVTTGRPGVNIDDVTQRDDVLPPQEGSRLPEYHGDLAPTELIIFDNGGTHCHISTELHLDTGEPVFIERSTGLGGWNVWSTGDAYDWGQYLANQRPDALDGDGGSGDGIYIGKPFDGIDWELLGNYAAVLGDADYRCGQIATSINRDGYFSISAQHSGFIYTTDRGLTWQRVNIEGGGIDWSIYYGGFHNHHAISPYNNGAQGWIYAFVAGDGDTFDRIYKSTNWGATWSLLCDLGGAVNNDFPITSTIDIPYIRVDGVTPNINNASQEMYLATRNGRLFSNNAGLTWTLIGTALASASAIGWSMRTFTWNGNIGIFTYGTDFQNLTIHTVFSQSLSVDDSANIDAGVLGSTNEYYDSVNGYSNNSQAALVWSPTGSPVFAYTLDGGNTWIQVDAPLGYIGVGYVEWSLRSLTLVA